LAYDFSKEKPNDPFYEILIIGSAVSFVYYN
jgi:hypothetical protein